MKIKNGLMSESQEEMGQEENRKTPEKSGTPRNGTGRTECNTAGESQETPLRGRVRQKTDINKEGKTRAKSPNKSKTQREIVKSATNMTKTYKEKSLSVDSKSKATSVAKQIHQNLTSSRGAEPQDSSTTSKAGFVCDLELLDESKPEAAAAKLKSPPGEKKHEDPRGQGPFFYIGGGNGAQLVTAYCVSKGWQRIYDSKREDYRLKWCELKSSNTYYVFKAGEQLVYQIPNNKLLTSKIGLLNSLREYERVMQRLNRIRVLKMSDFFPETFRLDLKEERETFFSLFKEEETWICKPTGLNQGRGIFLLKSQEQISTLKSQFQDLNDESTVKKPRFRCPQARITQRYIPNPLLLDERKFDVRSYMVIASTTPYFVFFSHGYVRLTCNNYDPKSDDLTGHLTNQYMQKKNPLYSELKEETVWGMERFNNYVNEKFASDKGLPQDWVLNNFTKRMQQIMMHCFLSVKSKLDCRLGFFDLIGCDFLVDEDFKVWLLEMNCNPALHTNCEVLREVIPGVVNETLDLTLEIFTKSQKNQHIMPLNAQNKFILLYNGENNEHAVKYLRSRTTSPSKNPSPLQTESCREQPVKNTEKTPKKPKFSSDHGIVNVIKPLKSKTAQRATLAVSPVQMTGKFSDFIPHANKPKYRHELRASRMEAMQKSYVISATPQLNNITAKPKTVAKIVFSGPQRLRILESRSYQNLNKSTHFPHVICQWTPM
ncbi:hypothetical protein XENTR_v10018868 [Xenopus tropicalis]|uniref:Inactive polyglycylase TTLL10 n=1 Tax=Xenopus tropicalis TaxID=8364 RepID=A0A6I8S752_XENTR|nr:hypothetical protein XENTR_v10018868 [Xenopus tropicalis]KAE8592735.1 hypothetical protein XENTR_v10018868 [Xenopus tropicalis]